VPYQGGRAISASAVALLATLVLPISAMRGDLNTNQTVLVVDDDETMLLSVEAMLRRGGYSPIGASGPFQALAKSRSFHGEIHLLLTDIVMPKMSGVALAQQLITERENIRILLMTGYTDAPCQLPLLRKPFRMSDFLDKVEKVISGPPAAAIGAFANTVSA
jgi:DNA-binding NtrC family response regulator